MPKRQPVPRTSVFQSQPDKPLSRRPLTACQACRKAKTACSREQPCERCSSTQRRCFFEPTLRPRQLSPVRDIESMMFEHSDFNDSMDISSSHPVQPIEPRPTLPTEASDSSSSSQETHGDEPHSTLDSCLGSVDWVYSDKAAEPAAGQRMAADATHAGSGTDTLDSNHDKRVIDLRHIEQSHAICSCRSKMHKDVHNLDNTSEQDSSNAGIAAMVEQANSAIVSCRSYTACSHCRVRQIDLVCIFAVVEKITYCLQKVSSRGDGNSTMDTCIVDLGGFRLPLAPEQATEVNRLILLHLIAQTEALLCCIEGLADSLATSRRTPSTLPRCHARQIAQNMHRDVQMYRNFLGLIEKFTK